MTRNRILAAAALVAGIALAANAADPTYGTKVYDKLGGDTLVVANGGTVLVEPGGRISAPLMDTFKSVIQCELLTGAAATGATGDTDLLRTGSNVFEYHIKGAGQTIICPTLTAAGIDIALDETNTEGVEITSGIATLQVPYAYTVGTSGAFQFCATATIDDASGASNFLVGFRKAEAYQADEASYADYALIGTVGTANPNTIQIETEIAGGGTTTTDTTNTWADNASKTLCVKVSSAGVVTYTINGAAPTATAAYTFANALTVIPTIYFLHGGDVANTVTLQTFEAGIQ